jgi:hypothetical protein
MTTFTHTTDRVRGSDSLDWLRSMLGVLGIFVALGVAAGLLAFSAVNSLKNVNLNDPDNSPLLAAAGLVALLPLVAGPILATLGGLWSGTRTRHGGEGALAGALGALVGVIVLGMLTALGYAMGANAANLDLARVAWPNGFYLRPGWNSSLGYLGTSAGVLYTLACALAAAIAGAVAGSLAHPFTRERATTRRTVDRMPRV